MTVKELKEILSHYNDDDKCYLDIIKGYGDLAQLLIGRAVVWTQH